MFTLLVQFIFSILVLIYALIPGHNLGLAIIIFSVVVRLALWPLVKKQLHHTKALRELQPELKKIKKAAKGDRQKEYQLTMELYKEKEIRPMASLGILLVQLPIFIGLYYAIKRIVEHPADITTFSYSFLHNLGPVQAVAQDISKFDETLFGVVDLGRATVSQAGFYWPAFVLVVAAAIAQFYQSKQLMPQSEDARSLKNILKDAGQGKTADQQEVSAAVGRSTLYIIPVVFLLFGLNFPAGLPLYWLVNSLVAYWQQGVILKEDVTEAGVIAAAATVASEEEKELVKDKKTKKKRSSAKRAGKRRRR